MTDTLTHDDYRMIEKLYQKINKQRARDNTNEKYVRGLQDIGNLGISVPPEVEPFAFPLNWCRTYTDVIGERQDVRMILRAGETAEDTELREIWAANDLDVELVKFNRDVIVLGRGCLSVAADPDGGKPRIRVESPKNLAVSINPVTRSTEAALRIYRDTTGQTDRIVLYRPDYTLYLARQRGKWQPFDRIEHGLGRVPIVMTFNRGTSDDSYEGESQLNDLKPLVNMAGRVMLQLQLAMETVATPQKVAVGAASTDFKDEDGNPVDPWETYLGAVWALTNKDAKVSQLPGADLTGFHKTITMLAEQASTITGLPVRMMGQNTANPAAEGSIRADESRLVKQIERLNSQTGAACAWALGIAERIQTRTWSADGKIQLVFHDPGTPTMSQRSDSISKLAGGVPVLSRRGAMHELGWSQDRIDQEEAWFDQEERGASFEDRLNRQGTIM